MNKNVDINSNINDKSDNIKLDQKPFTTCPVCGKDISEENDAGNGFCLECTRKGSCD